MAMHKIRLPKPYKTELDPLRRIIRSRNRKRISESVMNAGRRHRRRTFGAPLPQGTPNAGNGPGKETK